MNNPIYPHSTKELCCSCWGRGVSLFGRHCTFCDGRGVVWVTHGITRGLMDMITTNAEVGHARQGLH
jgi:DnaJ-class molecular chaperone